jgi:hypothetical protein
MTVEAMAPNAVGAPSAFTVESQRSQHVVFRGTDNQIHEIRWQLPAPRGRIFQGSIVVGGVFTQQ